MTRQIDQNRPIPIILSHFPKKLILRKNPRIAYHNVDSPKAPHHRVNRCLHRLILRQIHHHPDPPDLLHDLRNLLVDVQPDHLRPLFRQTLRDRKPDPSRAPRHQRHLALMNLPRWTLPQLRLLQLPVLNLKNVLLRQRLPSSHRLTQTHRPQRVRRNVRHNPRLLHIRPKTHHALPRPNHKPR